MVSRRAFCRRLQLNFIGYRTFCNTNIDIDTKHKVAIFVRSYSKELFEQNIFQNNYFDYIIDYTDSSTR